MTAVDRATRCIVGWALAPERPFEILQEVVDQAPHAAQYYSDGWKPYADVYYYGGQYQALHNKSQTYSVEADNAELRYYLARLHRKTRCFSKCLLALRRAVEFFVHVWNKRQLFARAHPNYPTYLIDFISL